MLKARTGTVLPKQSKSGAARVAISKKKISAAKIANPVIAATAELGSSQRAKLTVQGSSATRGGAPGKGNPDRVAAGKAVARSTAAGKPAVTAKTLAVKTATARGEAGIRAAASGGASKARPAMATAVAAPAVARKPAKAKDTRTMTTKLATSRSGSGTAGVSIAERKRPAGQSASAGPSTGKSGVGRHSGGKLATLETPAPPGSQAKPAVSSPAPRRPRTAASPKRALPNSRSIPARPPQSFTVSHLNEADFMADGLRSYAQYRELGIAAATAGLCQAHVIRFIPPCTDAVRKRHRHTTDLQLVYVLKGWMKNEFASLGEQMMSTGSCWLQPSGIEHTVLDYSADCEVLEIILPADFKSEDVD